MKRKEKEVEVTDYGTIAGAGGGDIAIRQETQTPAQVKKGAEWADRDLQTQESMRSLEWATGPRQREAGEAIDRMNNRRAEQYRKRYGKK